MSDRPSPEDLRSYPRYEVDGVSGTLAFKLGAEVVDISPGGMRVRTTNSLTVGRAYGFRLDESGAGFGISGRVAWCSLRSTRRNLAGEVEPLYEAGIAFEGVLSQDADSLLTFLRDHLIVDLGRPDGADARVFGRFRLDESEPVVVESGDDFAVEKLSLSGMLVRSAKPLPVESVCEVSVDLAGQVFNSGARIANIRDVKELPQENEPLEGDFEMGVAFVKVGSSERKLLEQFIRRALKPLKS